MPADLVGTHLSRQLVGRPPHWRPTAPRLGGAESRRDFVHKLQICLTELRETSVWLRFAYRLCGWKESTRGLADECSELIAIFVKSINTVKAARGR
jgi:hypothetical protein